MTRTASHARYVRVESSATRRVRECRRIKRGMLLKVLLRLTRDLFALFVQP